MKLAFLGLGQMGSAIAARLLTSGHDLTVWNRSQPAVEALTRQGAKAATTPADAASDADFVFTMLTDDEATRSVAFGSQDAAGFVDSMKAGATHITLSTISVELAQQLTKAHHEKQQEHLGSPVFGRPNVAAEGKLWLAIAGKSALVEKSLAIIDCFSRGHTLVGDEPWQAHALKLGGNFLITASIQMLSEAFVYATSQGIDPAVFLEAINSALFQSAFIGNYGKTMLSPPEKPGATVSLGIKDTSLFRQAAHAKDIETPLGDYLAARLDEASRSGWKDEDWAVGQYKVAQKEAIIGRA